MTQKELFLKLWLSKKNKWGIDLAYLLNTFSKTWEHFTITDSI